jgi:hypothetical protein
MARAVTAALLLLVSSTFTLEGREQTATDDPLQPLGVFIGKWAGTSSGQPGEGTVEREYAPALNGRFIRIANRNVYPPQEKNAKGEIHEDVGYISFDRARKRFVLRQFHVEGFVNQYVADVSEAGSRRWVFVSESIENIPPGWRARETYVIHGPDEFEELFELAAPGKDFEPYSRARLKRVR